MTRKAGSITAPIVAPSSTILAPIKNHPMLQQLSQMADRFWALDRVKCKFFSYN